MALPFRDGSFDGLVSYYAVIHVPRSEHRVVFDEFRRVLASGFDIIRHELVKDPMDHRRHLFALVAAH